jgi:hypothetical protein
MGCGEAIFDLRMGVRAPLREADGEMKLVLKNLFVEVLERRIRRAAGLYPGAESNGSTHDFYPYRHFWGGKAASIASGFGTGEAANARAQRRRHCPLSSGDAGNVDTILTHVVSRPVSRSNRAQMAKASPSSGKIIWKV